MWLSHVDKRRAIRTWINTGESRSNITTSTGYLHVYVVYNVLTSLRGNLSTHFASSRVSYYSIFYFGFIYIYIYICASDYNCTSSNLIYAALQWRIYIKQIVNKYMYNVYLCIYYIYILYVPICPRCRVIYIYHSERRSYIYLNLCISYTYIINDWKNNSKTSVVLGL